MGLERVSRWVWCVVGLLAGLGAGALRQSASVGDLQAYGECLKSQHRFEEALVRDVQGRKAFDHVTVYPEFVESAAGARRPVHVVVGEYQSRPGAASRNAGAERKRVFFVAESPYRPMAGNSATPSESVRAFLDGLAPNGVTYRYAWWHEPRWALTVWAVGGVAFFGGVWPTILTLVIYHSLRRPKEEPSVSLRDVRSSTPALPATAGVANSEALAQYQEQLEASVTQGETTDPTATPPATPAPIRTLETVPAEPVPAAADQGAKEFGEDKDDFYPTELKAPHPHSPSQRR